MAPFSIVMFVFALAVLAVSALIYRGDTGLVRTFNRVSVKDKRQYARFLGKAVASASVPMILSGIVNIFLGMPAAAVVLAAGMIADLAIVSKLSVKYYSR